MRVARMFLFNVLMFSFVGIRGDFRNCNDFYPTTVPDSKFNCTLVCGLRFHVPPVNETALCEEGSSTPVMCVTEKDCGRNSKAYCKRIPCYCEAEPQPYLIYHLNFPLISICVVPTRFLNPDIPLVPFPWLTLVIVFGILLVCGMCLVVLRWMSPYIRKMQSKRQGRDVNVGYLAENAEVSLLFSSSLSSRAARLGQSHSPAVSSQPTIRPSNSRRFRARYLSWERLDNAGLPYSCAVAEDKPPPYEIAVQMQSPPHCDRVHEVLEEYDSTPLSNDEDNSPRRTEACDCPTGLPLS